jgi:hypothetical protein
MAAINNNNAFIVWYGKSISNFGAVYAAAQELVKTQGTTIALLQGQVNSIQQYCMALQQHPPLTTYVPQQQQCTPTSRHGLLQSMNTAGAELAINSLPTPHSNQLTALGRPYAHQHCGMVQVWVGQKLLKNIDR